MISSVQATDSSAAARLAASFFVMIVTESFGTRQSLLHGSECAVPGARVLGARGVGVLGAACGPHLHETIQRLLDNGH